MAAGLLLINYPYNVKPHSNAELYNADFHPNTQKIGLRFTERLRNVFRLQWLRPR